MAEEYQFCQHYTPDVAAEAVARAIRVQNADCILDPAAGDGALLKAVADRFPTVKMAAMDIDANAARRLRTKLPSCTVSICDALDLGSVSRTHVWGLKGLV